MIGNYVDTSSYFTVYPYGEVVLRSGSTPVVLSGYIRWTPSSISGSFTMEGSVYSFEDYSSGVFLFSGGSITSSAFQSNSDILTIDTDADYIGQKAFYRCYNMSQVILSKCISIGSDAFLNCGSLRNISAPNCTYLGIRAFEYCLLLASIYLPECSYVGSATFFNCELLSQLSLPKCTTVGSDAFEFCYTLTEISLPECSVIDADAFISCHSLSQVNLPKCTRIGSAVFSSCTSLDQISLPVCSHISRDAFHYCTSLTQISLPVCSYLGAYAFYGTNLNTLILGFSSVCSCGSKPLLDTPFESGSGSIYVPSSLVAAYKADSLWSSLSSYIYPINN